MIPLLLAMLLGLAALLVVIQPLLAANRAGAPEAPATTPLAESVEREQTAKQALLDVELDHRLGNLEAEDYATLRARYEERALTALKARYDAERALDATIDEQLARLRARRDSGERAAGKASSAAQVRTSANRATRPDSAARPNSARARRRKGT